jgi:hypothetical protein
MPKSILLGLISKKQIINYSLNPEQMWKLWSLALGEKAHKRDQVADKVAIIRTIIFLTYLITNIFICANAIRHWNDNTKIYIQIDGIKSGKTL